MNKSKSIIEQSKNNRHEKIPPQKNVMLSVVTNSRLLGEGIVPILGHYTRLTLLGIYPVDNSPDDSITNPRDHIILMDGNMATDALLPCIQRWRRYTQPTPIIIVEIENTPELIVACIEAGAKGYTLRGSSIEEVAHVISSVQEGIIQCSSAVTAQIFERLTYLSAGYANPLPDLTGREMEVLKLVAQGKSNKEIAQILVVEVRTVKHHIHNILAKMNVRNRWDAARFAQQRGWLNVS